MQQAVYKEADSKACLSHLFVPKPTFPHEVKNESERSSYQKRRRTSGRTSKEKLQKMQQINHLSTSKEEVLKNDEYDPYAVIVLNQL